MGDYVFDSTESETLEANEMQMRKDVSDLNRRDIPLRLCGPTVRVRAAECDTCTCTDKLPSAVTTLKQQSQICFPEQNVWLL